MPLKIGKADNEPPEWRGPAMVSRAEAERLRVLGWARPTPGVGAGVAVGGPGTPVTYLTLVR
jgi:hypothetical protein